MLAGVRGHYHPCWRGHGPGPRRAAIVRMGKHQLGRNFATGEEYILDTEFHSGCHLQVVNNHIICYVCIMINIYYVCLRGCMHGHDATIEDIVMAHFLGSPGLTRR